MIPLPGVGPRNAVAVHIGKGSIGKAIAKRNDIVDVGADLAACVGIIAVGGFHTGCGSADCPADGCAGDLPQIIVCVGDCAAVGVRHTGGEVLVSRAGRAGFEVDPRYSAAPKTLAKAN